MNFIGSAIYKNDDRKNPAGFICIAHDRHEVEQFQKYARYTQKLAEIGKFTAGFAHEIKTSLAIIFAGIESLRISFASIPKNVIYHEMLDRLINPTKRADTIVTTLLDFSRQSDAVVEKLDVIPVIEETISMVERPLGKKKIID